MATFSELLVHYMQRTGISDGRLAWKLDITRQTIYRWKTEGVTRPNCAKIRECADVLRLSDEEKREFYLLTGCPLDDLAAAELESTETAQAAPAPEVPVEAPKPIAQPLPEVDDNSPPMPITGIPISRVHQFFGREREIKRIFKKWQHQPLESVAVVGARRSGKTSLLNFVRNISQATHAREDQDLSAFAHFKDYNFVYVDFQTAGLCEPERLLSYILENLNLTVPSPCNLANFTEVMHKELRQPSLLLLDEIDVALQAEGLDYTFWWGFRALVGHQTHGLLGLLISSHRPPAALIPNGGADQPSPFLNIIGQVLKLSPFKEAEARQFLSYAPQPLSEEDCAWMLEQSGAWPALLQLLCDTRLNALEDEDDSDDWKEEGLERIAAYQYLLER